MSGEDWDTIVLGAGVLGCATAYHIKRTDPARRVLLLDRFDRPAQGNTRRSVALFRDLFTSATNRDLASSTIALFDHIEGELGHKLALQRYGYYWLLDGERLRELREALRDLLHRGSRLEVHDLVDVHKRLGEDLVASPDAPEGRGPLEEVDGAVYVGNAGAVSPTRLSMWFEMRYRDLGGYARYGFPVDRLLLESVRGGDVRTWEEARVTGVEGPGGRVGAREVVVAAGAWTPSLLDPLGVDCHVKPQTRQVFGLVGGGAARLHGSNGFPDRRLPVLVLPSGGVYLKPVRSQRMLLAGCADRLGRPYALVDDPRPEDGFWEEQVRPVVEAYLPGMRGAGVRVSWAGQYHYSTVDGNPYVFRMGNLTVVAGASGSGIMKSDAIGRIAAGAHAGAATVDLFDGRRMSVSDLGVEGRNVQRESLII